MPFADAGDYRIHYEVYGDGVPVLCPGGWSILVGENHRRLPRQLLDNFRVIVFSHRGLGQSTDNDVPITTEDLAEDAALVIRAAGFGRAHVYGHGGLGACLSQHLAARHPGLVRGLVLVAGWAGHDPYKRAAHELSQFIFEHGGFQAYRRAGALNIHTPEYYNAHEAAILSATGAWGEFNDTAPERLRRIQRATIEHEARHVLPSIAAPTLVIHGELDRVDPPRLGRELVALIPNARLEVIPDTPHAMRTCPEGFERLGRIVTDFYGQLDAWNAAAAGWADEARAGAGDVR